jgi:hypothetical protein
MAEVHAVRRAKRPVREIGGRRAEVVGATRALLDAAVFACLHVKSAGSERWLLVNNRPPYVHSKENYADH